jgi:hypothetical protein
MVNELLAQQLNAAAAAVPSDHPDPLMRQLICPAEQAERAYMSLFLSIPTYLRGMIQEAKSNSIGKYGVYVKSLDSFLFGGYITVTDSDGEISVTLDYTFDADEFAPIIAAGAAITTDDPVFRDYPTGATKHVTMSDGTLGMFEIKADFIHTVYVLCAQVLRHYIETLLDNGEDGAVLTYPGLFTAQGYIGEDGNKKISIEPDELVKQIVKNDDANSAV